MKFTAGAGLFFMHCNALGDSPQAAYALQLALRWCVPFFFLASAYFLYSRSGEKGAERQRLQAYASRIGILYAVWFLINLPSVVIVYRFIAAESSALRATLLFLKNALLFATFTGSWYLVSSVFSAWLVYVLGRRYPNRTVLAVTFLLYALCVLASTYKGLLPPPAAGALDFLCFPLNIFYGCFYFALGKTIADNREAILAGCGVRRAAAGFVLFYGLFLAEIALTRRLGINGGNETFATPGIAAALLLLCLQADLRLRNGRLLRKLSILLYCCTGNAVVIANYFQTGRGLSSLAAFRPAALYGCAVCALVLLGQKRWKWCRYLT